MALIGLMRVSTAKRETQRQHDALGPICKRVYEEKIRGKLAVDDRPGPKVVLGVRRDGDVLAVQEVERLGRDLLDGLVVLNDLFQRVCKDKVLDGIAPGGHTERSFLLDEALALAQERHRGHLAQDEERSGSRSEARQGWGAAEDHRRGQACCHPCPEKKGESIRVIARVLDVSVGTVHKVLSEETAGAAS